MAAAKKDRWQATIRTLWAIAKSPELHMDSEDLHAVVYRETGKDSLKKLSQNELTPEPQRSAVKFMLYARRSAGMITRNEFRALSGA